MTSAFSLGISLAIGVAALGCGASDSGGKTTGSGGQGATTSYGATGGFGGSGTGGTATGGSGGAGGSSENGGGGGSVAKCTAMLCDDFESGMIDPSMWTLDVGYDPTNAVTVQSQKVHGGHYAAQAHVAQAGGGFAILRENKTFPALAESGWGRGYFYIDIPPDAGHTAFISAYVQANDARVLEIAEGNGTWALLEYDHPGAEEPIGSTTMIPLQKWSCLEWHFNRSTSPLIQLFVDGAPTMEYDTLHMPLDAMASFGIGVDNHSTMPSDSDVYIDDVVIDDKRVGCLK